MARCMITWVSIVLEVIDFINDWIYYVDMKSTRDGLVYGAVEEDKINAILSFNIIGTILFILEVTVFVYCKRTDYPPGHKIALVLSVISVWVEEIPQMIISLTIALCRDEPVSYFQLAKAGLGILFILINIIIAIIEVWDAKSESNKTIKWIAGGLILGSIIEAIFVILIFIATQTERSMGEISFKVPEHEFKETLNDEKYFSGVAVFLNHRDVFDTKHSNDNSKDPSTNWIRLPFLDEVRSTGSVYYKYEYQNRNNQLDLRIWRREGQKWIMSECKTILKDSNTFKNDTNICNVANLMDMQERVFLSFQYTPPEKVLRKRLLGHIVFNAKTQTDSRPHHNIKSGATTIEEAVQKNTNIILHFYKIGENIPYEKAKHLYHEEFFQTAFYREDGKTLQDVKDFWKTGWNHCPMTGYLGPPLDTSLYVPNEDD